MTQDELDTIQAMTSAQLNYRLADNTLNNETIAAMAAELARREQAAGVAGCHSCGFSFRVTNATSLEKGECAKCGADWPLHGKREQAQAPQPENLHPAEIRLATLRPKLADAEDALNKERAELARLRSLLAELTEAASRHVICMNFNLPYRGLAQEEWATREKLRAAIAKAKGGAL